MYTRSSLSCFLVDWLIYLPCCQSFCISVNLFCCLPLFGWACIKIYQNFITNKTLKISLINITLCTIGQPLCKVKSNWLIWIQNWKPFYCVFLRTYYTSADQICLVGAWKPSAYFWKNRWRSWLNVLLYLGLRFIIFTLLFKQQKPTPYYAVSKLCFA